MEHLLQRFGYQWFWCDTKYLKMHNGSFAVSPGYHYDSLYRFIPSHCRKWYICWIYKVIKKWMSFLYGPKTLLILQLMPDPSSDTSYLHKVYSVTYQYCNSWSWCFNPCAPLKSLIENGQVSLENVKKIKEFSSKFIALTTVSLCLWTLWIYIG